jgi:hypothetical protein
LGRESLKALLVPFDDGDLIIARGVKQALQDAEYAGRPPLTVTHNEQLGVPEFAELAD